LTGQPPVVREARDAVVDVSVGFVGEIALDELFDQADDLRNRLCCPRLVVRATEAEVFRVLDVPPTCVFGKLRARARSGVVDLVVDVGDVLDERYVVAPLAQPPA